MSNHPERNAEVERIRYLAEQTAQLLQELDGIEIRLDRLDIAIRQQLLGADQVFSSGTARNDRS